MKTFVRIAIVLFVSAAVSWGAEAKPAFYQRGSVSFDWFGSLYENSTFANRFSLRLRFDLISRPGTGWTLTIDARDRLGLTGDTRNQLILYNARLTFDKPGSPVTFSLGQMNLYDSAGIGQLMGGVAGFKIGRGLLFGAYGGLESGIYINRLETDRRKYGAFARWTGSQGKSASLSYNRIVSGSTAERAFAYTNMFLPAARWLILYGDAEYELGPHVASEDKLSRLFLNARVDLGRWADLTGSYSSGRGMDFRQFLIEATQDPVLNNGNIERFYYTSYYGARLSLKPLKNMRVFISRQESEQKDLNVVNHTWRFGGSAWNLFHQGIGIAGDYASNRGQSAESDSFSISLTKDFDRFSLNASFSNVYNGVRINDPNGVPEIIHLDDSENIGLGALVRVSRRLSASIEYNFFLRGSIDEHFLFIRLIYRSR